MHCQEKVLHCFPSIVEKIPIILLKQEEPWYNKTIEMARRLDLMSLRYAMALFFESTLFWCLCLLGGKKGKKNADKLGLKTLDYKFQYVSVRPRQQTQKGPEGHETEILQSPLICWNVFYWIFYCNESYDASLNIFANSHRGGWSITTRKQYYCTQNCIMLIPEEALLRNLHQAHTIFLIFYSRQIDTFYLVYFFPFCLPVFNIVCIYFKMAARKPNISIDKTQFIYGNYFQCQTE